MTHTLTRPPSDQAPLPMAALRGRGLANGPALQPIIATVIGTIAHLGVMGVAAGDRVTHDHVAEMVVILEDEGLSTG
jgi:hypothetical protein